MKFIFLRKKYVFEKIGDLWNKGGNPCLCQFAIPYFPKCIVIFLVVVVVAVAVVVDVAVVVVAVIILSVVFVIVLAVVVES